MKVGTDGVLLGAWAPIDRNPASILDIGTGSGVIALMLAQRSLAQQIDALEIEANAYEQAVDNFENSPWADRLFCYHAGLDEFVEAPEDEYDLIVSNPPFFTEDYFSNNEQRDQARFQQALPFEELLEAAALLLSEDGVFCVIVPYTQEQTFVTLAREYDLFAFRITRVKGTETSGIKRSLIALQRAAIADPLTDALVIEISRHIYTPEYTALTRDFYMKM